MGNASWMSDGDKMQIDPRVGLNTNARKNVYTMG